MNNTQSLCCKFLRYRVLQDTGIEITIEYSLGNIVVMIQIVIGSKLFQFDTGSFDDRWLEFGFLVAKCEFFTA